MYSSLFASDFGELVEKVISCSSSIDAMDNIAEIARDIIGIDISEGDSFIPIDIPVTKDHLEDIITLSERFDRLVHDMLDILIDHGLISYVKVNSM